MIFVCGFHELNPFHGDGVLNSIKLCFLLGHFLNLLHTVDTVSPLNEEVKMFLDLVLHSPDDLGSHFSRVVWDLGFKLAGVLVDPLDSW